MDYVLGGFGDFPMVPEGEGATAGQAPQSKKGYADGNANECGVCGGYGKLICCDDCPGAFHADCLGYTKQCPRGKWKCYFCKVIRHGIPKMVPRMAPNEEPVCDILADTRCSSWEQKASQMFDILEDYFCAKSFFEPLAINDEQLRLIKKRKFKSQADSEANISWRPTSLTDLRSRLDRKEFIAYEQLWTDIQVCLQTFIMGLGVRDTLHIKAQVTNNLLLTLVDDCQIFEQVTAKKFQVPSRAEKIAAGEKAQAEEAKQEGGDAA